MPVCITDELDPLLVSERERLEPVIAAVGEPETLSPQQRGLFRGSGRQAMKAAEEDELVEDPHPWIKTAFLRHVPKAAPLGLANRPALPAHLSLIERDQPEHRPHRRRLAGGLARETRRPDPGAL